MGLADNTSWAEMVSKEKAQYPVDPNTGRTNKEWIDKIKGRTFVQILNPATGTGTFIKHTIELIHREVKSKHERDKIQIPWLVYWNDYVYKNLLTRIYGFELMMASYSVAHMKIGMYLKALGYKFEKEQRLNIYLTNSLEPHNLYNQRDFFFNSIGAEAEGANNVKCNRLFTVVIGNPPYSINSSNMSDYQMELVNKYKYINGVKLNERGALQLQKNTNDDYIKFFAFAQGIIAKSGIGIVGFISNNNFINARTLRGFRWNLLDFFNTIRIYDLHGDSEKGELSPDGSPDENVFNIKKGVAISFLVKMVSTNNSKKNEKSDIWGLEGIKYRHLNETSWYELERESIEPAEPNFLFSYVDKDSISAYLKGESLDQIFNLYSSGIITARDNLTINFEKEILMEKVNDLVTNQSLEVLRERHEIAKDSTTWKLSEAIKDLIKSGPSENNFIPITYRLFDDRYTYYTGKVIGFYTNPRLPVMQHLKDEGNIALCCCKQVKSSDYFQHVFVTQNIVDSCFISNKTSETGYAFPLFIKRKNGELNIDNKNKTPNLKLDYIKKLSNILQIDFSEQKDLNSKNNFSCYDIFDFVYAILNSWKFRRTYKDFLKIDFPRIPNPKDNETFWRLVKLGGDLRVIHLLQSQKVIDFKTSFPVIGNNEIGKSTAYKNGKVYINSEQYFDGVPEIAWNFYIGGYQPAQKWLKDRKGRILSDKDIIHYQKIIVALTETDRIMKEIDQVDFMDINSINDYPLQGAKVRIAADPKPVSTK